MTRMCSVIPLSIRKEVGSSQFRNFTARWTRRISIYAIMNSDELSTFYVILNELLDTLHLTLPKMRRCIEL